jgi:hypothetical protein
MLARPTEIHIEAVGVVEVMASDEVRWPCLSCGRVVMDEDVVRASNRCRECTIKHEQRVIGVAIAILPNIILALILFTWFVLVVAPIVVPILMIVIVLGVMGLINGYANILENYQVTMMRIRHPATNDKDFAFTTHVLVDDSWVPGRLHLAYHSLQFRSTGFREPRVIIESDTSRIYRVDHDRGSGTITIVIDDGTVLTLKSDNNRLVRKILQ